MSKLIHTLNKRCLFNIIVQEATNKECVTYEYSMSNACVKHACVHDADVETTSMLKGLVAACFKAS